MNARILVVEDDPIQARILGVQLKHEYEVAFAASGEECLETAAAGAFDLILLDVMLPGISGYEVCRRLQDGPSTAEIPVIFLSANFTMDDRLKGFEAGGFDYMVKPVVREELVRKIAILVNHVAENRDLKRNAAFATTTAMTAMTSAAEQGLVLQFMKASYLCHGYLELATAIVAAIRQFGLEPLVQIRGRHATLSRSGDVPCTPLEESVLSNLGTGDRIVDLKNRTAINFPRVSVLLKNMPIDDPERYGRIKDNLTLLLEGADARVAALDMDMQLAAEAARLIDAVDAINGALIEVNRKSRDLHKAYGDVFSRLAQQLEAAIPLLELNQSQEAMLESLLAQTSSAYVLLADQESAVNRNLLDAMEKLHQLAARKHSGPAA